MIITENISVLLSFFGFKMCDFLPNRRNEFHSLVKFWLRSVGFVDHRSWLYSKENVFLQCELYQNINEEGNCNDGNNGDSKII